jgi:eukaryotic-like serine/threonine-protein kinase
MSAPDPTSMLGATVEGRYKVLQLIGEGGMCAVYRAEDQKRNLQVALKVMPAACAANQEMAARFNREASAGKRIQHPNVTSISDSGTLPDGGLYLVMELLDGEVLGDLVEKGPLPIPRALAVTRQMLLGLGAAHQLGMIHRDVKPDNVMLVGEKVKLLDFGIASNDRAAFKLTAAGLAFGTPEYLSPEMAMGLPVDLRADLYSVGVVLYQMVTGKLPFEGDQKALLRAHIDGKPPPPRARNPKISPALERFILRALEKLPEQRFTTAQAMVDELDAVSARAFPWWLLLILAAAIVAGLIWFFRSP